MSHEGLRVIDWMTASRGDPTADVARTVVISTFGGLPDDLNIFVRSLIRIARGFFFRQYLKEYVRVNDQASIKSIRR